MGAAIPHMMLLVTSLPLILPFPREEIKIDSRTYTVDCTEEIVPEDEEEDISYRVKGRSAVSVLIRVGDEPLPDIFSGAFPVKEGKKKKKVKSKGKGKEIQAEGDDGDDVGTPIREDDEDEDEDNDELGEVFVYEEESQEES